MPGMKYGAYQADAPTQRRHGRACPGHPRLVSPLKKGVDARHKAGHDELYFIMRTG
jgi:hypothetical protein